MFSGMSEEPDYFAQRVPIAVLVAPVSQIGNTTMPFVPFVAKWYKTIADTAWMFNMQEIGAAKDGKLTNDSWCTKFPQLCLKMSGSFVNTHSELDDPDRYAVSTAHGPNGTSVKDILHYAQTLDQKRFQIFSETYGNMMGAQRITDLIPLKNIKTPVAMFTGKFDPLADLVDSRQTRDTIGKAVVHYEEIPAGHQTFMIGKDMSYWTNTVMGLFKKYHPLP